MLLEHFVLVDAVFVFNNSSLSSHGVVAGEYFHI